MSDEEKEGSRRTGFGLRNIALLVVGLAVAVATGFGVKLYLERQREALSVSEAADQPLQIDWMFIDAGNVNLVIEGRKVYEANCANCHGYGMEGQPNWRRRGRGNRTGLFLSRPSANNKALPLRPPKAVRPTGKTHP